MGMNSPPLLKLEKVQAALHALLRRELSGKLPFKLRSYAGYRVFYLRAVSKLRPTFFEDDEDFLDREKRIAQWEKRQRFNDLKRAWIRYDKTAPDKARDLSLEDQEIENDLDMIEEDIQTEWLDFASELLDMLDADEDDDEEYGDEDDLADLEHWRDEKKQMKQDESLLKRRILERSVQRRVKEELEQQKHEREVALTNTDDGTKRRRNGAGNRETEKGIKLIRKYASSPLEENAAQQKRQVIRIRVKKCCDAEAPRTPRVVRPSNSFDSPFNMSVPNLETGEDLLKLSTRSPKRRGSLNNQKNAVNKKVGPTESVTLLKAKFKYPLSPKVLDNGYVRQTKNGTNPIVRSPCVPSMLGKTSGTSSESSMQFVRVESPESVADLLATLSARVDGIITVLSAYKDVPIPDLIQALANLCDLATTHTDSRQHFSRGKGNIHLAETLQYFHKVDPTVTEACCKAFVALVEYETNRDALALAGVIEYLMVGMLQHRECASLQVNGCDALRAFAVVEKYKDWIAKSNGIQVLVKTQTSFLLSSEVQVACFRCMTQLADNHRRNARSVAADGGVKGMARALCMPEHGNSVMLHREALKLVATLARDDDSNRGSIAKEEGIYLTLSSMESFSQDEIVQDCALQALCALATDHAQNCKSISEQGGLPLIIRTMKHHSSHEAIQAGALSLLQLMTKDDEVSAQVVDADGICRVLAAMSCMQSAIVHEQGCLALCNMSIQEENKDMIRNFGGIARIVSAMRLLKDNTFVQKSACRALDSLATSDPSKVNIAASGGVSAMIDAMRNHASVAGVQSLAIAALRKVATVTRNRNIMKENDGIEAVEHALQTYPRHMHLQEHGNALMKLLDPTRSLFDPASGPAFIAKTGAMNEGGKLATAAESEGSSPIDKQRNTVCQERKAQDASSATRKVKPPNSESDEPDAPKRRGIDAPGYKARHIIPRTYS